MYKKATYYGKQTCLQGI